MAQQHQPAAGSTCPGCDEPLEPGDRFCGACGYDLSAVPAAALDRPTVAIGTPVEWPTATGTDTMGTPTPTQRAADVPGTDSDGEDLLPPTGPLAGTASAGHAGHERPRPGGSDAEPIPAQGQAPGPVGHGGHERADESMTAGDGAAAPDSPGGGHPPASAVRFDTLPSGDFELAAPAPAPTAAPAPAPAPASAPADPRTAAATGPAAAPTAAKLCVACRAGRVDTDGYCENCGHAQPRERDHMEEELGPVAAVSDRGLRHHRNEDAFAVSSTALPDGSPAVVAVVCDGVSSATRPDEASAAAASAANELLLEVLPRGTHPQQAMHEAIVAASEAVNALAEEPEHGPGDEPHRHQNAPACTIVGAVAAGGLLIVGWVGDSRAYWVPDDRSGPPARLTEDDSWAAQMVAAGLMNEAEAYADERAHAITGWLGADAYELEPHTAAFKPDRSGVVVVCTDGLWNYAEAAEEMARAIPADASERPLHSAQMLVGHALDGGGHDNVTVAVLPFAVAPQGAGSAYDMA
ncbi:PP2C family serine/threonine-protein phosphatase [Streptomyces peucetius]|uniref:Protein phosphatase 2C domain-containing protein n=1 Tax=Streptomyces peucetius TaxID=1950 RepID=A0ABY6I5A5_STRPE|nr:PP2C family serine/threonine-protein phosphatase [Streptomyces peucetius]UYQ62163.1 protein phosphatase 2C domain-containing protein [Streptomyces peucetius]